MKLAGSPIAPGLGMGPVSLVGDILERRAVSRRADARNADDEWTRIEAAFADTRRDLEEFVHQLEERVGSGVADIFRAHELMLDSLLSSGELTVELRESALDASGAVRTVFLRWAQ